MYKEYKDKLSGGLADKSFPWDFDKEELKKGIEIEKEHTNDRIMAMEIAMDHLKEDPHYYTKLLKAKLEETYSFLKEALKNHIKHIKNPSQPSSNMLPQISPKQSSLFLEALEKKGVKIEKKNMTHEQIYPSRDKLNWRKVLSMMKSGERSIKENPIIVSQEGYIIDGHHRSTALEMLNNSSIVPVNQINLPIKEVADALKQMVSFYDGRTYQG